MLSKRLLPPILFELYPILFTRVGSFGSLGIRQSAEIKLMLRDKQFFFNPVRDNGSRDVSTTHGCICRILTNARIVRGPAIETGATSQAFSLSVKYRNVCPSRALLRRGVEKQPSARTASEICSFVYHSVSACFRLFSHVYGNRIVRKGRQSV